MNLFRICSQSYVYGIQIYAYTTSKHLSKLTVLNNKLLRMLQHKPAKTHISELYQT